MSKFQLLIQQQMDEIVFHSFIFQALISLFLFWCITKLFYKPAGNKNLPPSPRKLPIIGHIHRLGLSPHHNLRSLAEKYGPLMLLQLGSVPTLIVSSAEGAQEIMKTHDLAFADRPKSGVMKRLLYDFKDVAAAPYSEYWRQLKSIFVLQLLSNKRVQSFRSIREEETALLVNKIRESHGNSVDLSQMFTDITNDVACRSAFGRKYHEREIGKNFLSLLTEMLELLGTISVGDFVPLLGWISLVNGYDARVEKVAKELDEFLEGVLQEHVKMPKEQVVDDQKKNGENFVDILLDVFQNNSTDVSIDRDSIKAMILDVFAAGTDTTSTVLEWAMTELLRHPAMMKRLQNEVREIAKGNREITDNDLGKMPYLKAVIKETLRYHPPIPLLVPRVARKDVKVMGYNVSAGTMVMTNFWAIGRDPLSWEEPEKFNPDRFLNSSIDFKGLNFELIPFGAGRRACPGISFAMATNELVIANLVQKFDWKLPDEGKDLDMTERPGLAIHRAVPLLAVASEYV